MKYILICLAVIGGAFLEALFFKLPFVLIVLLLALLFIQKPWTILLSIPAGIIVDSMNFRLLGESSLFFAVSMGVFFLYARKFEVESIGFALFASFLASFFYFVIFGSEGILIQTFFSVILAGGGFLLIACFKDRFARQKPSYLGK